ncbi:MAG: HEPN domain-containing protein [Bacteroidota bacterium]
MQSFRTELENPLVEKDIIELERKIREFRAGLIPDEKFRSLRLARGVYGQRQQGVQMVRIKLPYGKVTFRQLLRIADISDEYSTGNLHLTTRQDIQIHHVSLDRTPELWAKLEQDDITLREACGNTVRNITASPEAGIDPEEPFDVTPYADAMFRYFLRNPVCQEMGRKIKMAFSSSVADSAFTFMHDAGFIPVIRNGNKGFRIVIGGGLGAQPSLAHLAHEFLPKDQLIPFVEALLRVFDRHGERNNRNKARLKFLVNKIGLETFLELVEQERTALKTQTFVVQLPAESPEAIPVYRSWPVIPSAEGHYGEWLKTNVFAQKQEGYFGVYIKVLLGDIHSSKTRELVAAIQDLVANDIRVTANQGLLLKFVSEDRLEALYNALHSINLAETGFDSALDITACPGTDTCNLAISSSTGITAEMEKFLREEYPELVYNRDIRIKISGCMNSCGQHGLAHIGFHGSSLKGPDGVVPALQVLLGGGTLGNGNGRIANKVLKVPSKRGLEVLAVLLDNYNDNSTEQEKFNDYFDRVGEKYFYDLMKPLTDITTLTPSDYVDWGNEEKFSTAIGVGECAGVMIDLVATLLFEADEKLELAGESLAEGRFADSIYQSYAAQVHAAKALLLDKGVNCNTQSGILTDFDKNFGEQDLFGFGEKLFSDQVLLINKNEPLEEFAAVYFKQAAQILLIAKELRAKK